MGVTYYITDEKTGKETGISSEEYWKRAREKEAAKPKRPPTKAVVKDPVVRKFEYTNGTLTERKVKQTVLDAEKKAKVAAIKAADIAKRAAAKIHIPTVATDTFPLKYVIIGMVGLGAAILYLMRRKKK